MADLKEETTVDNSRRVEETETKRPIDPSMEGIQLYYEKNKKIITYVGGGLAILIAALVYFKLFYLPEQETEAANEMFWAETYFERDSFALALRGGVMVMSADGQKPMMGFEQIAEQYNLTKSGNLANYYAGICYLRTGQFEQAIEYLGNYDGDDEMVAPIAIGAIGDAHMELNHIDDAVKFYTKASDKSNNSFTTPYFLRKAAFASELNGDKEQAIDFYERIRKEYPRSTEGQQVEKDIARLQASNN